MRSAEALKKAAGVLYPEAEIIILDTFRYTNPFLERALLSTYLGILKMSPSFYGYLYRRTEHGNALSSRGKLRFARLINTLAASKLAAYIEKMKPQIIVCTHPFPLGITVEMKKRGEFKGALFAVITDFTIHSFWVFPEVDFYIVGSEHLVDQCEESGIEKERILSTGIPIDPAFGGHYEKGALRERLGLKPGLATILIMGGGLGMGPLLATVQTLGNQLTDSQILVVAGTNKTLFKKLGRITPGLSCKIRAFRFVDNMHELMQASDLMVGKAGGLTCAEALATGLPQFIVEPLPGHEERNTDFITVLGAGYRVKEKDLAMRIRNCLFNPGEMAGVTRTALLLGKPEAACSAVRFMAKTLSGK